jgi:hypothetical protein
MQAQSNKKLWTTSFNSRPLFSDRFEETITVNAHHEDDASYASFQAFGFSVSLRSAKT